MKSLGEKGLSLVEALIGAAILAGAIMMVLQLQDFTSSKVGSAAHELQINNMLDELSQDIRSNIKFYQMSNNLEFKSDDDYIEKMVLPMAWRVSNTNQKSQELILVDKCKPNCPEGRIGYRIVPLINYAGFYAVYIVYSNEAIFKGKKLLKFFVKGK